VRQAGLPATVTWSVAVAAAVVALASDLRLGGWSLPVPRQVDERWLTTYRRWIYAAGYGVQIGTGFATYIMTAGVYLLATLAVLTGHPGQALAAGLLFGLVRGLAITVAAPALDADRLRSLMARVDAAAAPSVLVACGAHVIVAGTAAWLLAGPAAGAGLTALLALGVLATTRGGRRAAVAS